ncbi:MAG: thiol reductase thioredoxin [Alphaproteobacteria bacterium]|nr:thiol reductase thioredoxin [Alphaproteobacteria bacterium]
MSELVEQVTDETFDAIVERSQLPYLIEFASPSCTPCTQLEPVLADIARDLKGRLRIGRLDISSSPDTPERLGVRSTPTMLLFKAGQPVRRLVGTKNKRNLLEALSDHMP